MQVSEMQCSEVRGSEVRGSGVQGSVLRVSVVRAVNFANIHAFFFIKNSRIWLRFRFLKGIVCRDETEG